LAFVKRCKLKTYQSFCGRQTNEISCYR